MSAERWPVARHIYLSPHLDDAVLSCGGRICRQRAAGESVAVVTFFTASRAAGAATTPLHQFMARAAGIGADDDLAALRRDEDERALAALGAGIEHVHLDLPDAMFRTRDGAPVYTEMNQVLGPVRSGDPGWECVAALADPPDDATIYVPLGRGHADHVLVREWADDRLARERRVDYEDYPYDPGEPEGELEEIELSADERSHKLEAIRCYRSQLRVLWNDDDHMVSEMIDRNERYWWHRS